MALNNDPDFSELPQFTKQQLSNYLKVLKEKLFGSYTISLSEVRQYCENNIAIPDDLDKVYVCGHEIFENDNQRASTTGLDATIRIFFSTRRLLMLASNEYTSHIAVDATYKLVWQGYPAMMIGSTDRGCHYQPFGFAVCTNEETVDYKFIFETLKRVAPRFQPTAMVADASPAITAGFIRVYGEQKRIMCWIHMMRNAKKYLMGIPVKQKIEIIADIESLQLSANENMFEKACSLFVRKWTGRTDQNRRVC